MIKEIDLTRPALLLSSNQEILIENLSISKSLNNPSTCNIIVAPNSIDNLQIGSLWSVDLWVDGEYKLVYYGILKEVKNAFDSINLSFEGPLSFLDYFPVESSEDEIVYDEGTNISNVINDLISKSQFGNNPPIRNYLSGILGAELRIEYGQTLGDALREIVDLFGGFMAEVMTSHGIEIRLSSISNLPSNNVNYDRDLVLNEFTSETSNHLYRVIYVRSDTGQEIDTSNHSTIIKKISNIWVPYPFSRRAIYYTYKGSLTKAQAIAIANSIEQRLQIGRYTYSMSYASLLDCQLLDKVNGYVIDTININYSLDPINLTTTITGFSL